jgi:ATP-binding cassette subfamily B (MDR/TAP) protein 1
MGDGLVRESGIRNDLLQADGAYARLVQARKLREVAKGSDGAVGDDTTDDEKMEEKMEKIAREEISLGRKSAQQSLASEILE